MYRKLDDDLQVRQRPFKIFLSLLDRWEIGLPLTDALCLQALHALSQHLTTDRAPEDLIITASMLFGALDPFLVWRRLFHAIQKLLQGDIVDLNALDLIAFIQQTFILQDEEIVQIHVPLIIFAMVDLLEVSANL